MFDDLTQLCCAMVAKSVCPNDTLLVYSSNHLEILNLLTTVLPALWQGDMILPAYSGTVSLHQKTGHCMQ